MIGAISIARAIRVPCFRFVNLCQAQTGRLSERATMARRSAVKVLNGREFGGALGRSLALIKLNRAAFVFHNMFAVRIDGAALLVPKNNGRAAFSKRIDQTSPVFELF